MGTNVAARQRGMTEDGQTFYYMAVDYEFIEAYGLDIKSGRGFSREMGSDDSLAFILNEAAYLALGWQNAEEPIGDEVTRQFSDTRNVIGVAGNFNYQSLQFGVEPLVLFIQPSWYGFATRSSVGWEIVAIAIALSLSIALITVAWQSVRAALADPAVSLRTE
jgi:hypothetical protein